MTVDGVDGLYLNAYVPPLRSEGDVVAILRHRGRVIPLPALFGQIIEGFRAQLRAWAQRQRIPWIEFPKRERKDGIVQRYRARFAGTHGVTCVGVAQEEARAWTTTKEVRGRHLNFAHRWKTVCVNHYYLYVLDREWDPAFLKICEYAPYTMKLGLNGHERVKQQLRCQRVAFTALTNGVRTGASNQRVDMSRSVFGRTGSDQITPSPSHPITRSCAEGARVRVHRGGVARRIRVRQGSRGIHRCLQRSAGLVPTRCANGNPQRGFSIRRP